MQIILSPYFGPGVTLVLAGILIFIGIRYLRNSVPAMTKPQPQQSRDPETVDVVRELGRRMVIAVPRRTVPVRNFPEMARVPLGRWWETLPVVSGNRHGLFVRSSCGTIFRRTSQVH